MKEITFQTWFVAPYLQGNFDAGIFSFYDFMLTVMECKVNIFNEYMIWQNLSELHYIYPLNKFCIISQKPSEIYLKNNILHNDNGPSLKYMNEVLIWSLNGVVVPQWLVETRASLLDPDKIHEIENAEVRREFIRKIGIERVMKFAEIIDTWENYQLLNLKLKDGRVRPYLKMKNPSVEGIFHVEGVAPGIKTIRDALHWRKPQKLKDLPIDDINGSDWYQQGDVCVWPKNAISVKFNPSILT